MADVTVAQFADVLKVPVDKLLSQLRDAGIEASDQDDTVSNDDKKKLLAHLRASHGKVESDATAPRRVTPFSLASARAMATRWRSSGSPMRRTVFRACPLRPAEYPRHADSARDPADPYGGGGPVPGGGGRAAVRFLRHFIGAAGCSRWRGGLHDPHFKRGCTIHGFYKSIRCPPVRP